MRFFVTNSVYFNFNYIFLYSESGPLMLSPTGQFISPARCPGSILVDFITKNLELARENTKFYKKYYYFSQI